MVRFLINTLIFLGSSALGIWVTSLILEDFTVNFVGLLIAAVIFTVAQGLLSPFIFKMTTKYANAFIGGVGLLSTFVALLITTLLVDDLAIDGVTAWVLGTILVWLVTAIATWVLPLIFLRNLAEDKKG